ncbi:nuclear transport factor 2 family protein [Streptococcus sp. S784/96/1]|uniref:nuclear transport factor 2 family protein n=1 Tax=Streptococcus sp. S784/96/1 TaxID=2653499 RepID=UPI003083B51E
MKQILLLVGIALLLMGCQETRLTDTAEQSSSERTRTMIRHAEEEILKNLYSQVNQAMVDGDIQALEKLLKPETELIHMTGYRQPVAEWLDAIASGEMAYYSWQEEAITNIQMNGDTASLIGQSRVKARIWGSGPSTWPLQIEMHFEKQHGQWIITKQIASTY